MNLYLCFQNAEFELHANQSQLDQMNNKGLQLLDELKNIPNFDMSVIERDLDEVNHKWETANSVSHFLFSLLRYIDRLIYSKSLL